MTVWNPILSYCVPHLRRLCSLSTLTLAAVLSPVLAHAGAFDVGVSPSRFEISAKSSGRLGQTLEIFNQDGQPTELSVRTLDWEYSEKGELKFFDELRPGSCRPWFTLERKTVRIDARSKASFRFQIDVPADAGVTECRVMLAIEGVKPAYQAMVQSGGASLALPVNGRVAVAVYVSINGAQPVLSMSHTSTLQKDQESLASVTVTNTGTAHGRLDGALDAKDASGLSFELVPDGTPILPGQTRNIMLKPRALSGTSEPKVTLPVKANGTLDWENGSFKINAEFH